MTSGKSFTIREHRSGFGPAVVEGLVAADMSDPAACRSLRAALRSHALMCIRFEHALADGDTHALASMIGPVKDPVGRTRDGGELRYSEERQIVDAGFVLTEELRAKLGNLTFGENASRPGLFETFHTDDSYTESPALATVLFAA